MQFKPIGVIHSPFKDVAGMPIQPVFAEDIEGVVEVFPQFRNGLRDIKPYVADWGAFSASRSGWLETAADHRVRSDERFSTPPSPSDAR